MTHGEQSHRSGDPRGRVDLHLRWARLGDHDPASIDHLLTPAERGRAERPSRTARGRAFALGRALSRATVADLSGLDPREIGFEADGRGKPRIVRGQRRSPDGHPLSVWQHSVSHSGDLVVVAVARGAVVGVDVEAVDDSRPMMRLAKRFFHPDEVDRLAELPPEALAGAFHELWTRKEAVLKALGSGLSGRLDSVLPVLERTSAAHGTDPTAHPGDEPPRASGAHRTGVDGVSSGGPRWKVQRGDDRFTGADLVVPSGHRGAVAVGGELGSVDVRRGSGLGGSPPS